MFPVCIFLMNCWALNIFLYTCWAFEWCLFRSIAQCTCTSVQVHLYVMMCMCGHTCATAHTWRSEDNLRCQSLPSTFEARSLSCSFLHIPHDVPCACSEILSPPHFPIRALRLQMHTSHGKIQTQVLSAQKHLFPQPWMSISKIRSCIILVLYPLAGKFPKDILPFQTFFFVV